MLLGLLLVAGSSGNFRSYLSERTVSVGLVTGENAYVSYICRDEPVYMNKSSGVRYTALTLRNLMDAQISFHVSGDYSGLPEGLNGSVDGSEYYLNPGESVEINATFSATYDVASGNYTVPLTIYAEWEGGSAELRDCSLRVEVENPAYVLKKGLVGKLQEYSLGNHTLVLQLNFTNNGPGGGFEIVDFVPTLFHSHGSVVGNATVKEVSASRGSVLMDLNCSTTCGNPCWCHCLPIIWHVYVDHGETVTLEITLRASFHAPGDYVLNCGAHLCGTSVVSEGVTIHVTGG